ncbi:hypothetical protein CR194_04320 [Salipaludibacillus keqinensis]|uniref:Uncharacterized protein n=1 Tax=Salipaludibacillus keqinensis TaxID=2045207 RepID=A0A323TI07_9BACI|nr:hypothetical protein [Salipaludibacillus keqinensis]PYZ94762.1 hypothetical protein CR194_04320 [Salipaludibacillus keqinensis]
MIILAIFSNGTYNLLELRFLIPTIFIALGIGIAGVYVFGKDMKLYKSLPFISYVMTVGFAFVPVIGVYVDGSIRSYGFPTQWVDYSTSFGYLSFNLVGFVVNYLIIYFILRLLSKMSNRFLKRRELNEA